MALYLTQEIELSRRHEEILSRRAALLQQMEDRYEKQKRKKQAYAVLSDGARERNAKILKDLQALEDRLSARPLPHPDIVNLETQYWTSVEEKVPEWEQFLLGKVHSFPSARIHAVGKTKAERINSKTQMRTQVVIMGNQTEE
nr:PREDICTED: uncharacterized protein C3orf14 homolog isoform X2 [Lepisosteus oculatus]